MENFRRRLILWLWTVGWLLILPDAVQGQTGNPQPAEFLENEILENDILIRRALDRIDSVLPKLKTERDDWDLFKGTLDQSENTLKAARMSLPDNIGDRIQAKLIELRRIESESPNANVPVLPAWFSLLPNMRWRAADNFFPVTRPFNRLQPGRGETGLVLRVRKVLLELDSLTTRLENQIEEFSRRALDQCGYDSVIFDRDENIKSNVPVGATVTFLANCNEALQTHLSTESFEKVRSELGLLVSEVRGRAESRIIDLDAQIENLENRKTIFEQKLARKTEISDTLIRYALPAFGMLILLLLLVPRIYSETVQASIFGQGLLLEVLTVFLLTASILILGLADKIPKDALGTLLGGISGYVLGRTLGVRRGDKMPEPLLPLPAPPPAGPTP